MTIPHKLGKGDEISENMVASAALKTSPALQEGRAAVLLSNLTLPKGTQCEQDVFERGNLKRCYHFYKHTAKEKENNISN